MPNRDSSIYAASGGPIGPARLLVPAGVTDGNCVEMLMAYRRGLSIGKIAGMFLCTEQVVREAVQWALVQGADAEFVAQEFLDSPKPEQ